ncbi:MAG: hypothetical protein WCL07_03085 [bacterium]
MTRKYSSRKHSISPKIVILGVGIILAGLLVSVVRAKYYGQGPLLSYFANHGGVYRIATNLEAPGTTIPLIAKVTGESAISKSAVPKTTINTTSGKSKDDFSPAPKSTTKNNTDNGSGGVLDNYAYNTGIQGGSNAGMTTPEIKTANIAAAANGAVIVANAAKTTVIEELKAKDIDPTQAQASGQAAYDRAYNNSIHTSNAQAASNEAFSAAGGDTAIKAEDKTVAAKAAATAYAATTAVQAKDIVPVSSGQRCQDKSGNSINPGEVVAGSVSGGSDSYWACNGDTGGWITCDKATGKSCTAADVTLLPLGYVNYGGIKGNDGKAKCWSGNNMYQDGNVVGDQACHDGTMIPSTDTEKAAVKQAADDTERLRQIQQLADKVAFCENPGNHTYDVSSEKCMTTTDYASAQADKYAPTTITKKQACEKDNGGSWIDSNNTCRSFVEQLTKDLANKQSVCADAGLADNQTWTYNASTGNCDKPAVNPTTPITMGTIINTYEGSLAYNSCSSQQDQSTLCIPGIEKNGFTTYNLVSNPIDVPAPQPAAADPTANMSTEPAPSGNNNIAEWFKGITQPGNPSGFGTTNSTTQVVSTNSAPQPAAAINGNIVVTNPNIAPAIVSTVAGSSLSIGFCYAGVAILTAATGGTGVPLTIPMVLACGAFGGSIGLGINTYLSH